MSWSVLLLMALIVFISRYLFLEPRLPLRLGPRTLHFLHYIWFNAHSRRQGAGCSPINR